MASADNNFTVIDLDNIAVNDASMDKPHHTTTTAPPASRPPLASDDDHVVVVATDESGPLPQWLNHAYLALSLATIILGISVAVLSGIAGRRLYLYGYEMGTEYNDYNFTAPDGKIVSHHYVEPRRRDILMSFLIYSPCVVVGYALVATVGIPAYSMVRVKGYTSLSVSVQEQLRDLKRPYMIWLSVLTVCLVATTVAFFIAPGKQWPRAFGVAPLLTVLSTLGLIALTWKM